MFQALQLGQQGHRACKRPFPAPEAYYKVATHGFTGWAGSVQFISSWPGMGLDVRLASSITAKKAIVGHG